MGINGSILGDIIGSVYEFDKPINFDWHTCNLLSSKSTFTDDTVLTLAIKQAIIKNKPFTETMVNLGKNYVNLGYGSMFYNWLMSSNHTPYNSYGNGSAMRVSFVADYFDKLEDVQDIAEKSAKVTHNHPEGIKGAVTTASCIFLAKTTKDKNIIYDYINESYQKEKYAYPISIPLDELRESYIWSETCQNCVPVAIRCVYEANSYEEFIRNVLSLNCDADTLGAIGGGVAEELYGLDSNKCDELFKKLLTEELYQIYKM